MRQRFSRVLTSVLLTLALLVSAVPVAADDASEPTRWTITELWSWLLDSITDPAEPPPNNGGAAEDGTTEPLEDPPAPGYGPGSDPDGGP